MQLKKRKAVLMKAKKQQFFSTLSVMKAIRVSDQHFLLFHSGDEDVSQAGFLEKFKTYVMLQSNGTCTWMAPTTFKSSCSMDITNFPFDSQACEMTFGSWTYDSRLIRMEQLHEAHNPAGKYFM